jgi:hypothetical protein
MNMAEAHTVCTRVELHLREIDRTHRRAVDAVVEQLARDFPADPLLRLLGRSADMRSEDHVLEALNRAFETSGIR